MERVVANTLVKCVYDCTKIGSWSKISRHEIVCLNGPAVCPADGCRLEASNAALLDHMSSVHEWPTMSFRYDMQFDLPAEPGSHVLRVEDDDDHIFVLTVSKPINRMCTQHHAVHSGGAENSS